MTSWDILVVDKSGSMIDNKKNITKGFNELISSQKNEMSDNLFTVFTFNDTVELFIEDKFKNVQFIDDTDIVLSGTTALYDAIGNAYDAIIKNKVYKNITLTVITDGYENSSKFYTQEKLNDMKKTIDENYTISMIFIGTESSCITTDNISQHATHRVNCFNDMQMAFKIASRSMSSQRESYNYIPEGSVNSDIKSVTPLTMKRTISDTTENPPKIKRCKTMCKSN
tara:strand:- start:1817 stop:2494 length:678 start_codon:yes stop_codon:yes gene_type:complete